MTLSLCVYCGSRDGLDPAHLAAAREVGRQIGQRGWRLVYGGGSTGLMGAVADAVKSGRALYAGVSNYNAAQTKQAAAILKTRTLTNLYNQRPTWLDNAHRRRVCGHA